MGQISIIALQRRTRGRLVFRLQPSPSDKRPGLKNNILGCKCLFGGGGVHNDDRLLWSPLLFLTAEFNKTEKSEKTKKL